MTGHCSRGESPGNMAERLGRGSVTTLPQLYGMGVAGASGRTRRIPRHQRRDGGHELEGVDRLGEMPSEAPLPRPGACPPAGHARSRRRRAAALLVPHQSRAPFARTDSRLLRHFCRAAAASPGDSPCSRSSASQTEDALATRAPARPRIAPEHVVALLARHLQSNAHIVEPVQRGRSHVAGVRRIRRLVLTDSGHGQANVKRRPGHESAALGGHRTTVHSVRR